MTIGERIKKVRELANLSQIELAQKIGVSKQNLYKYENSLITNIPSDKIEAIAQACDVTPSYLMGWEPVVPKETFKMQTAFYGGAFDGLDESDMQVLVDMANRLRELKERK